MGIMCYIMLTKTFMGGGGLMASVRTIQAQSPEFESRNGLVTFLCKTTEWPKITHMLPSTPSSTRTAM